jgi:peptidoglycan lytic transglycosylase A
MGFDGLAHSIGQSLAYLKTLPSNRPFKYGADAYTADHLRRSMTQFLSFLESRPDASTLNRHINRHYRVYRSPGGPDTGRVLFTGYYEPILAGSPVRTDIFRFPIYGLPDDLVEIDLSLFSQRYKGERIVGRYNGRTLVPYHDRRQIDEAGAIATQARVLAWVRDPIDLFFLHIQGSGRVVMNDGTTVNVLYHGKNGRPYRSIGKLLIDRGAIAREKMSMQAIRAYLAAHPQSVSEIFNFNPSYVFFRSAREGPVGCIGVELTPGRSVATDRRIFPMAALAYVAAQQPLVDGAGEIRTWNKLNRFVLNQDTGGAIRGTGRADLFFGSGPYAETAAGHLKHAGDLFFLVLRP